MVIFGKAERNKFEVSRDEYSALMQANYDAATTYHDGKWIMIELSNIDLFDDIIRLLKVKRRPDIS